MSKHERLVIITGGGDWYDASLDLLMLPVGTPTLEALRIMYMDPEIGDNGHSLRAVGMPYESFAQWLIRTQGARYAKHNEDYEGVHEFL